MTCYGITESFAKWCKYGVKMSGQAQRFGIAVLTVSSTPEAAASGAVIGAAVGSAWCWYSNWWCYRIGCWSSRWRISRSSWRMGTKPIHAKGEV